MSIRNAALEGELLNIEESGVLNGFYMFSLLFYLKKCTLNELATAMYLFRFVNITHQLLNQEDRMDYWSQIPEWERNNLDSMLANVLIEKYNGRFLLGIKELTSRGMILTEGQNVALLHDVRTNSYDILENPKFKIIMHKAKYVSKLMESVSYEVLKQRINRIIGGS